MHTTTNTTDFLNLPADEAIAYVRKLAETDHDFRVLLEELTGEPADPVFGPGPGSAVVVPNDLDVYGVAIPAGTSFIVNSPTVVGEFRAEFDGIVVGGPLDGLLVLGVPADEVDVVGF